jgi:hypothetical protein
MKPVSRDDLWNLERYERERPTVRREAMADKDRRRLEVGDNLSFLFESRKTVWYQVQEMLRTERIFEAAGIQHELDTYNELVPAEAELTATLMIQFTDPAVRDVRLVELVGLDDHVHLVAGERVITASFDHRQFNAERMSAVQFIRWDLGEVAIDALTSMRITHPTMEVEIPLPADLLTALASDAEKI